MRIRPSIRMLSPMHAAARNGQIERRGALSPPGRTCAALTDPLGEDRRALEGLSYRGT
jgi:hypothetical protein